MLIVGEQAKQARHYILGVYDFKICKAYKCMYILTYMKNNISAGTRLKELTTIW